MREVGGFSRTFTKAVDFEKWPTLIGSDSVNLSGFLPSLFWHSEASESTYEVTDAWFHMIRLLLWICCTAKCILESAVLRAVFLNERVLQVWVSGSRRFDGSCSFHRDDQTQRSTVRVPNIFSSTVWNSLYVTSWQLESWCCSWIYGKICVPIPKRVVYCFCTVLIFRGRG